MKPVHISETVDRSVDVSVNLYKEALTQEVDGHLHEVQGSSTAHNSVELGVLLLVLFLLSVFNFWGML